MSVLIKDLLIVTQNSKREIFEGDILIKENKIQEIKKEINEKADLVINGKGKIAIPGLINTHTHVAMTLFRGYGEGLDLHNWLTTKIWPAEAKLTPEAVSHGTLLGCMEMISSGTTSFNEMYLLGLDEIAQSCEKIGIRSTVALGMFDKIPGHSLKDELKNSNSFIKNWKNSSLITPAIACHAPYTCSEELLIKGKELATKENLKFHIHASETRKELFDTLKETKKRPFEYLDSLGLIDSNSIFAHASWVSKREIKLAGDKSLSISHNPVSNLKLATGGICPIYEYHYAGANVTLGTDGAASNNSLDMFESLKFTALLQKHKYWNSAILSAQKLFDFATINGAKALGLNSGSLEKGKLADIVLLDAKSPNMVPSHDLISNLVYSCNSSNVTDVIINGKLILENKEFKTINKEEIYENVEDSIDLFK